MSEGGIEDSMVKIGIIVCDRNRTCTGYKCFKSIANREGMFSSYPNNEDIMLVGWVACGGCPGERLEFAAADMKKIGADVIHLASCYLAGYPACPYIGDHKDYIENVVRLPVVIGTHPMPQNYIDTHNAIGDWKRDQVEEFVKPLASDPLASRKYDSTRPNYLKEESSKKVVD